MLCYLSASVKDQDDAFIQELQVPFFTQSHVTRYKVQTMTSQHAERL